LDVLEKYPQVSDLVKWSEKDCLKIEMDKLHPLAYPLLRWIISSNRCHLKKLSKKEQLTEMNTPHQYLLLSSTPKQEKTFQTNKTKYGAIWAFHGSALCNWHAILRKGLKNMSGTKGQVNGAAYGSGVYLAEDAATSFGYMRYMDPWKKSIFAEGQMCLMAVCEIAKGHPDLKGMPNPYWVVAKDELIATRYFCIYPNGNGSSNLLGSSLKPPKVEL
jgi:poly [ADP-ribose] polymerase 6/8